MSVYETAVSAYRDTTKWLVAFAPVTALVTAAVTVGPSLINSTDAATDLGNWLAVNWGVAVSGAALFSGIAVILYFGAQVLSVAPKEIGQIQDEAFAPRLAKAIGEGVTAPEFFDKSAFEKAMAELANAWDQGSPIAGDDARLTRLRGPIEALRQWSIFDEVHRAFTRFCFAFVTSSLVIAVSVVAAASQLDDSASIDKPTSVLISTDGKGQTDLRRRTGCRSSATTRFTAIGGTWNRAELAADGPHCRFGAVWRPAPGRIEIRIAKPS